MSINLVELFHIQSFSGINWANIANGPWFMLGIFLMLNAFGLFFRARTAWAVSIVLLLITLVFTMHFYPNLNFSISLCLATLVGLLLLGKDFNRSSATAGGFLPLSVLPCCCFIPPTAHSILAMGSTQPLII